VGLSPNWEKSNETARKNNEYFEARTDGSYPTSVRPYTSSVTVKSSMGLTAPQSMDQ